MLYFMKYWLLAIGIMYSVLYCIQTQEFERRLSTASMKVIMVSSNHPRVSGHGVVRRCHKLNHSSPAQRGNSQYLDYKKMSKCICTRLFGKDRCSACSSDRRNSATRLKSVSRLAGYCRAAHLWDLGSENGPPNGCDDLLASSGGVLPAMAECDTTYIILIKLRDINNYYKDQQGWHRIKWTPFY